MLSAAKYLLGLKTQGENAKVQLRWMEGDIQKTLGTFQCRYTQQSLYCGFFVDLQNEEEPGSNTHFTFLQTKSFCRDK